MPLGPHRRKEIPAELQERIEVALEDLAKARAALAVLVSDPSSTPAQRRAGYAEVTRAFEAADRPLREATRLGREHSYLEWARWRHRLSTLGAAKQQHLFAERDADVLVPGTIRALDTGMTKPAIGEFIHGENSAPGAAPNYGIDLAVTRGLALPALEAAPADRGR